MSGGTSVRRTLAFLLASVLVLGACNDSGGGGGEAAEDPKGSLTSAVQTLGEAEGLQATFTVESTIESLSAAGEGDLKEEDAQKILDSSISIRGKGETPEDAQAEIIFDIAGHLVEMRVLADTLYVRADTRELIDEFGGNQEEADQFVAQAPPGFEFAGPLIEGEWIAIEGAQQFSQQFGAPSPDVEVQKEFVAALEKAIDENATVTSEGSDDQGDHVRAAVKLQPLYTSLQEAFGNIAIPGAQLPDATEIPDETLTLDFWIQDDQLSQIQFDFTQFREWEGNDMPEGVEDLTLNIDLEESTDDVEAPEAAASVDFAELMQTFFGGMTGSTTESAPAEGDVCSQLVGAPPEVLEQFAEECPELQPQ